MSAERAGGRCERGGGKRNGENVRLCPAPVALPAAAAAAAAGLDADRVEQAVDGRALLDGLVSVAARSRAPTAAVAADAGGAAAGRARAEAARAPAPPPRARHGDDDDDAPHHTRVRGGHAAKSDEGHRHTLG